MLKKKKKKKKKNMALTAVMRVGHCGPNDWLCRLGIQYLRPGGVIRFRGTCKVRDNFRSIFNYIFQGVKIEDLGLL